MGPRGEDVISLKANFEQRLEKLEDAHLEQRLKAMEKLEDARWDAHREVHTMGQLAIDEALKTLNLRLEAMNEFRSQIYQERSEFLKHDIYDSEHKTLETRFESATEKNSSRISILENNQSNQAGKAAAYASIVGLISGVIAILISHFWK